jgi:hypothetical protein
MTALDPLSGLTPYAREVFELIAQHPEGLTTDEMAEHLPHWDLEDHIEHAMTILGPIHRNLIAMGRRKGTMRGVYRTLEAHTESLKPRRIPFKKPKP